MAARQMPWLSLHLRDLSIGGLSALSPAPLERGERLTVSFPDDGPLPRWDTVPGEDIDLDHHFHHAALPAPGGQQALSALVSRLHAQRMDRRHPLWEVHVIEGVGARTWALYFKFHHSQVDGVGQPSGECGLRIEHGFAI